MEWKKFIKSDNYWVSKLIVYEIEVIFRGFIKYR